ncbi:unnamed protein product [Adineta steineri]|uniref:Uncharacterized protein n=1 Tax=Adineta steineri TaxID=433720 RepID=A0A816AMU0_9BILA|nr:unnamed protein product [Adineta steineri]CAF1596976.1 unnamed protein product [Adineta steineri]
MQTIANIDFDSTLYSQAHHWMLILYQMNEPSMAIHLDNVHLMRFIQPFDNMPRCQNYINTNTVKTFTLFSYIGNILTWLWNNNAIPDHLNHIIIFCPSSSDKKYLQAWTKRYTKKIRDIITHDALDRELLIAGMKYIEELCSYCEDEGVLNLLKEDHKKVCLALMYSVANQITLQDEYIRLSEEAS